MLLLLVWVGPVTFAQTDTWQLLRPLGAPGRASAESQVIPAGMAMQLEPGTPLTLRLHDGSVIKGRYLGRTLLDTAAYAPRFAAYARSSSFVPFVLGETLHVSLRDGGGWTAPFAGYGELTLLLRGPDGGPVLRAPFEFTTEIRRANGDRVEPSTLIAAFRAGSLPSAEALALEQPLRGGTPSSLWSGSARVAVEDIESAIAELPSGANVGGAVALGVLVSVVLVFVILGASLSSTSRGPSCDAPEYNPQWLSGVRRTTRPFDRYRACYTGDPLAVADPWPGPAQVSSDMALADPPASSRLMR